MSILKSLNTPVFAAEGIMNLDPEAYRLTVDGLSSGSVTFTLNDLKAKFSAKTTNVRLTSVSGWSVRADWNGILWRDFIEHFSIPASSRYAVFGSAGGYTTCVLLTDLASSSAMLTWGVEGQPLEAEYGGPLRMIIPNLWGYKSCKWLVSIGFIEKYRAGYWEQRGYSHRGEIEPGETLDVNTQSYRPISGGEVTDF